MIEAPSLNQPPAAILPLVPPAKPAGGLRGEPRLTVCMLVACPFPANLGTAGSIREMAEAVVERGHAVHIVTYHMGEEIPVSGPHVHRIPAWTSESSGMVGPTVRRPLYDVQMVFKAVEVIRRYRCDLIQAHGYEAALVGWLCRLLTGRPVLYTGHNTMADELPSYRFIRPRWLALALGKCLDALVPRIGDRCLPHSQNMQRFFHGMGLAARTEPVVPFGIDVAGMSAGAEDSDEVRRQYGLGGGPVVVYVGMLDDLQRPDLLLAAVVHVARSASGLKLLVVVTNSGGGHVANFRRRAAAMGLADRVVLTEPQPLAAVPKLLSAADVGVAPRPRTPGLSIKLLNYMAVQIPCVLFASSASKGMVDRENAMLASPDTAEALGEAILELLRDGDLSRRLASNGHQFVRDHHDRGTVARQVCGAYVRTLAAVGRAVSGAEVTVARGHAAVRADSRDGDRRGRWPEDAPTWVAERGFRTAVGMFPNIPATADTPACPVG